MMSGDYNGQKWAVKSAEFRGFVKASLESIDKKLDLIDKKNEDQDVKIGRIDKDVNNIKSLAGVLGAIAGTVATIIIYVINMFRKGG